MKCHLFHGQTLPADTDLLREQRGLVHLGKVALIKGWETLQRHAILFGKGPIRGEASQGEKLVFGSYAWFLPIGGTVVFLDFIKVSGVMEPLLSCSYPRFTRDHSFPGPLPDMFAGFTVGYWGPNSSFSLWLRAPELHPACAWGPQSCTETVIITYRSLSNQCSDSWSVQTEACQADATTVSLQLSLPSPLWCDSIMVDDVGFFFFFFKKKSLSSYW